MPDDEQKKQQQQQHHSAMDVRVLSSHMVLPSPSLAPHPATLWTSNLDLVILNGYIKTVYFFPPSSPSSSSPSSQSHDEDDEDIRRLRLSLSTALSIFWPMAGRLSHDASGRLQIDCNDAGALFLHASCLSCSMDSLPGGFVPNPNLLRLVPSLDPSADLASSPLLLVQVTRFKCGGVAVGVGIEHHVADGKSAVKFLNAWASLSRGIPFTEKVNFDRSCLQARTPPTPEFVHEEYLSLPLPPNYLEVKQKKRKEVNGQTGSPDEAMQNGLGKRKHSPESNGDQLDCNSNGHVVAGGGMEKNGQALGNGHAEAHKEHTEPASCVEKNGNGHIAAAACVEKNGHAVGNGHYHHHHADNNGHVSPNVTVENGQHHATTASPNNGRLAEKGRQHVDSEGEVVQNGLYYSVESSDEDGDEGGVIEAAATKGGPDSKSAEEEEEEVVVQMVDISKEFVQRLKEAGAEKKGLEKPLTSHEMLAAQVWRSVCEARKGGEETSRLIVAVDGRARMRGLPDGYFGNVIFTSVASAAASEVAEAAAEDTALRVRRALRKLDDPYCRSALDFLELEPDTWRFVKGAHTWAAPNVGFTSWAQLPMYECDFGWGVPCHIGPAHVAWDGLAYVTNPTPAGLQAGVALRLIIALRRRHANNFLPAFFRLHHDAAAPAAAAVYK